MTPMLYFLVNVMLFWIICQDDTANIAAKGGGAHCENIWQSVLITLTLNNEHQGSFKLTESSDAGCVVSLHRFLGRLQNIDMYVLAQCNFRCFFSLYNFAPKHLL